MNRFAIAFGKARMKSEKTFRQIKEHIGLSIGYLSDIENGKRNPPEISIVEQFEKLFGVTDGHLVILAKKERVTNPIDIGNLIKSQPKLQEVLFRIDGLPEEKIDEKLDRILEELRKQVEGKDDPWLYRNIESSKFLNEDRHLPL